MDGKREKVIVMAMTERLFFRLSLPEVEDLDTKAQKLNLNRSDFLRLASALTVRRSLDPSSELVIDAVTMQRLFRELNHWGVNYNQGVRALNIVASRIRKTSLTDEEKAFIALQSKNAAVILRESKDGLLHVNDRLLELTDRQCITIPPRLMLKLEGD
jgi:hypothetical protein